MVLIVLLFYIKHLLIINNLHTTNHKFMVKLLFV